MTTRLTWQHVCVGWLHEHAPGHWFCAHPHTGACCCGHTACAAEHKLKSPNIYKKRTHVVVPNIFVMTFEMLCLDCMAYEPIDCMHCYKKLVY
jgi:hypothetical protein